MFSYGLLLHYCLSGGRHAFGESYERDFNILQARALPACGRDFPLVPSTCCCGSSCPRAVQGRNARTRNPTSPHTLAVISDDQDLKAGGPKPTEAVPVCPWLQCPLSSMLITRGGRQASGG